MSRRDVILVLWFVQLAAAPLLGQDVGADNALVNGGLGLAPADAAFFASWSRQGEQFNILRQSRAAKRFLEFPSVRRALQLPTDDPELIATQDWLSQPIVKLALDALSNEVFVYGDANFTQLLETFHQMSAIRTTARLDALARGKSEEEAKKAASQAVRPLMTQLRVPSIVVGLKLKDRDAALTQLTQLNHFIQALLADDETPPQFRNRYKSETINGQQFHTVKLDASMIPLNLTPSEGTNPEDLEQFKKILSSVTLVLAIGLHEDCLIISAGHSTDHLNKLAQGPKLIDHRDLGLVRQQSNKRLTSVRYTASDFRVQLQEQKGELARLSDYLAERTKGNEDLSDDTREKIRAALTALKKDLGGASPDIPPAAVGFTYMTDDGYEGFDYNTVKLAEHGEALSVLDHVGDDPLLVLAGHSNFNKASYEEWKARLAKGTSTININDQDAGVVLQQFRGFFDKLSDVVQEDLIPALENGQWAWVISASDESTQWHPDIPKASQPLPLPEASLVMEVKDPAQLLKAVAKSYRVANELLDTLVQMTDGELNPEEMTLPDAVIEETPNGKVYAQPLTPDFTNIPANLLAPSAGISDHWLVISPRPGTAKQLLRAGSFGDRFRNGKDDHLVLSVAHINVRRLTQLLAAWYAYADQISPMTEDASSVDVDGREFYRAVIELAGSLQSYQRVTYVEDGASVIHTVWRLQDKP